jgi:hypothetical protein
LAGAPPTAAEITPPPGDLSGESFTSAFQIPFTTAFQILHDHYLDHYPFSEHKEIDWSALHAGYLLQIAAAQAAQDTAAFRLAKFY